jgi:hypothetical protein
METPEGSKFLKYLRNNAQTFYLQVSPDGATTTKPACIEQRNIFWPQQTESRLSLLLIVNRAVNFTLKAALWL